MELYNDSDEEQITAERLPRSLGTNVLLHVLSLCNVTCPTYSSTSKY